MDSWHAHEAGDKAQILAYLNTDRLYAAYAVGDLEPALYAQSAWAVAESGGVWRALALHFRGLQVPALFVMGQPDGVRAILEGALYPSPAYLTCRAEHVPLLHEFYDWPGPTPMWRMALDRTHYRPVSRPCSRLGPDHAGSLADLYALGGGAAFGAAQLDQGVFYGILDADRVVAVAGTHLVSQTYSVAAVGNVFTHPDYRGRGYATHATSAVVDELLRRGIRDIILNVGQANMGALHIYEQLGFGRCSPFYEGPAAARSGRALNLRGGSFTIRPVRPDETPAILEVYRQCEDFLALGPVSTASEDMVLADLELSREQGGIYCGIYDQAERMIGVVDVVLDRFGGQPECADLSLLMIAAPHRRQGIGAEVVALVEGAILRNPEISDILSGVQVNNPAGMQFWAKNGYRIVGGPELMPDQTTVYHLRKEIR